MIHTLKNIFSYRLRFNPLFNAKLKEVLDQKQWDINLLKDEQNYRFLKIFSRAIKHSEFYIKLYADHGVNTAAIKSIDDLHRLPTINKQHIRSHLDSMYLGNSLIKTTGHTSGSSGTPLHLYRDYWSTLVEGAYIWSQRAMFGLHPGMKIVSLRGKLGRHNMRKYNAAEKCLYLSSFNMKREHVKWYYRQLIDFKPYAILAYPSSVEILANLLLEENLSLNIPYIFTSSEQVYPHQRTKVERVFNTKIIDWYGNAERTIALEQRKDSRYYELPLYSVNEYQEDKTITTSLIAPSLPLIRYEVDDIITQKTNSNTFQIDEILGRHDDVLVLPDGTRIGRIGAVLLDIKGVEFAQIVQETASHFTFNLVVNDHFNRKSREKIQAGFYSLAGDKLSYDIALVSEDKIVRTQAGKYKLVISTVLA